MANQALTKYTMTMLDGSGVTQVVECASLAEAREAAGDWAREGDYPVGPDGEQDRTVWEDVRIEWIDEDGDECEDVVRNIAIDPPEPKCVRGKEHDWQRPYSIVGGLKENPGVWGSGGGVKGVEVCVHCGCAKHWDSWAQRPDNGVQGLDSVRYVRREFIDQIKALDEDD